MATHKPHPWNAGGGSLIFDVPGGRLSFSRGDLDIWAEHLTWCYRLMGVGDGATIAVQDFGNSPLSFLASALLMPGLTRGVAERLDGRVVCLDASSERLALTPSVLNQLATDVLVVRGEVADLLALILERARAEPPAAKTRTILTFRDDQPMPGRTVAWRYMLHVESAMLLAPQCRACGEYHLRGGFYRLKGQAVKNLRLASAGPWLLHMRKVSSSGRCDLGPEDVRLRMRSPEVAGR